MPRYTLNVNGRLETVDCDGDTPLLWVLRDFIDLTGPKFGCGQGHCGICTVHLAGRPVRSCLRPVASVGDAEVTTIEGLSGRVADALVDAWVEEDVSQCGYCQPGQIMTAAALLRSDPGPTETAVARAMDGVLCRCGTYLRVRAAIGRASARLQEAEGREGGTGG